ncbi:hypothetical protein BN2475_1250008 [Paraburkholderia ribeironis]|uniref:Uncharacterized protein n=1 Tax=Paraburkholderia ribeironis TaxID=1247936 RepID=A0A1N7SQ36_9BURK|nr:hypothetical protein BN2475_1250008 [Paraburkholderia ribeironis]
MRMLDGHASGQQMIMQFLRPLRRQLPAEERAHFFGFGTQHFGKHLRVVSVSGQTGFEGALQETENKARLA